MGRTYSFDELYGSFNPGSVAEEDVPWSTSELNDIHSVLKKLQDGDSVTSKDVEATTELLERGIGRYGYDTQVRRMIKFLYQECKSPQARARIVGVLLSPDTRSLLTQMLNDESSSAQVFPPDISKQLLKIAEEPSTSDRVKQLVHLLLKQSGSDLPHEQAIVNLAEKGEEEIEGEEQDPDSEKMGQGGKVPEALQKAIADKNAIELKVFIEQSPSSAETVSLLVSFGEEAEPLLQQIVPEMHGEGLQTALGALLHIESAKIEPVPGSVLSEKGKSSPSNASTLKTSTDAIDTSELEQLLLNPESLPSALSALIRLGAHGQAILCERLVSTNSV